MSAESSVSLELLAHGQQQVISEVRSMKDDMGVMMAFLMRLDGTVAGMVNELRSLHKKNARQDSRLSALEATQQGESAS